MTSRKVHPYYQYGKLLSFNAVYNFLVGGRGRGKTYGAKKKAIKDALKGGFAKALTTNPQFIYLRRYKTEMSTARNTFFADLIAQNEFPNWDFRVVGNMAQASPITKRDDKKREWATIGYFIALSTAQTQKSVSFPRVTTIIFDEFIIELGNLHYLQNESTVFNNFYSTVDRSQDKTRVFFLANSVSIMNPYFIEYEIRPNKPDANGVTNEFVSMKDGFLVAHFDSSEDFTSSVMETRFGKFIKDTDYAKFAVANEFSDNTDALVSSKDSKSRYMFTLECRNGMFSVWYNMFNNEYFVQDKLPRQQEVFTLLANKMDSDKTLMTFSDMPISRMRTAFRQGKVTFDKPATRNTFADIFKR